ncbi:hypothetical protein A2V54_00990 [candidate division WWE3 bacterium RBG_19FT_COMBO_53_11]|uniref:Peptidase S74 domain-containing protein n=1 Tax=candidate division WWE3 bacterium RBG_19FT_COMBO_53_11 TaxID=1802613 RepID=A0A1F4UIV2_UNCKA|nr:MAG: hypothetical protein A2155_00280 [candidate division WWE3 bacterium RBG_16_52_45]OGC44740.1 MAG: hypothetical protein A2V54_00990 [candidate division WWE3 bacterium RBG_19FT_COMBO_53_11]
MAKILGLEWPSWSKRHYRRLIQKKLTPLTDIYSKAVVGDFSQNLSIPEEEDEFTEIYVGTQLMLEIIREKLARIDDLSANLENKIEEKTVELERLNKSLVGRELKMVGLKKELAKQKGAKDGKS